MTAAWLTQIALAAALATGQALPASGDECVALLVEAERIGALRDAAAGEGVIAAREGLARARAAGCTEALAEMYGALGDNLNVTGERAEALAAYRAGIALLEPQGAGARLASLYRREGIVHADAGDLTEAVERALASLRVAEAVGDGSEAAMAAGNLATLYSRLLDFERARRYFEQAHAGFLEAGNRVSAAGTGINLATLLMRQADELTETGEEVRARALREQALVRTREAMAAFEELGHARGLAMAASNAGVALGLLGRHREALALHRRALAIREEVGDRAGRTSTYIHLAMTHLALENHDAAERNLSLAEELAQEESLALRLAVAQQWVRLEEARGRLREALSRTRELSRLNVELATGDHQARIAEIQARYDTEQQALRIQALQREREIANLALARQRAWLAGGGAAVFLLLLSLALLVGRYRLIERHVSAMELAARTDPLTGLPNRREIRERIEYEMRRSHRTGAPFTVAVIDLDDFKRVNDRYGHGAGDQVLRGIAERIRRRLRAQDTVARWGGDELLLLLPDTAEEGAGVLMREVTEAFATQPVRTEDVEHHVTLTAGVAQYRPGMSLDECVHRADGAIYRGKALSKNQVVLADSIPDRSAPPG
jgi:diguanylate cyclase (GGDEF)-like protein